jgi:hypothetical protein
MRTAIPLIRAHSTCSSRKKSQASHLKNSNHKLCHICPPWAVCTRRPHLTSQGLRYLSRWTHFRTLTTKPKDPLLVETFCIVKIWMRGATSMMSPRVTWPRTACWWHYRLQQAQAISIAISMLRYNQVKIIMRRGRTTGMIVSTFNRGNSITLEKICKCSVMIKIPSRMWLITDFRRHPVSWTSSSQLKKPALSGITRRRLPTYLIPSPWVLMLYHLAASRVILGATSKISIQEWRIYPC